MSVTTTLAACSQTPSLNGPDGTVDAPSTLDDAIRYALSFIAQLRDTKVAAKDIAAAVAPLSGRNVIVNGDCSVSQINGGNLITPVGATFPIDMVGFIATQGSKLQAQQVSNLLNSLGATSAVTMSVLSSYSPIATDQFTNFRTIEGFNAQRFQYGTPNAKAASLQFKALASVAGTYSCSIQNAAQNRSYPISFVLAANTDTLIQIPNIPGDTSGVWTAYSSPTTAGIYLITDLGSGSNFKSTASGMWNAGAVTTGSWQGGSYYGVTGTTNLVSQVNGSTLTITDVQFEVGPVCTQFERKLYDQNIRECQRYLTSGTFLFAQNYVTSTSSLSVAYGFPNPMRVSPTITLSSITYVNVANLAINYHAADGFNLIAAGIASGNANFGTAFTASAQI